MKGIPGERMLAYYSFEGGGQVQIVCSGPVSTKDAIDMAQKLLDTKRAEIERIADTTADQAPTGAAP